MKRILSLALAVILLLSCAPMVSATDTPSVTVYLTVSKHNDFAVMNGKTMALEKITVPYFDLALYGLEDFYYNPFCYEGGSKETQYAGTAETADGYVTMLHLFLYATEVLYNGLDPAKAGKGWLAEEGCWNGFSVGGDVAGSSYCKFWEYGNNATYYVNYEFPLGRSNWGASCDQVVLSDNDIVSVRYNANTGNDGTYHHFGGDILLTAVQGDDVPLVLLATSADYDNGGVTVHTPVTAQTNIYVTANAAPVRHASLTPIGKTDTDGAFTLKTDDLAAGTYYITTDTHDPAVVMLILEAPEETIVYGDVNGDGEIRTADAVLAYAIANGKRTPTEKQQLAADTNGDGEVRTADAVLIYAYANGKRTSFPAENK